MKISFSTNVRGDIETLTVPLEPTGRDITFRRVAAKEMREKSFLEQFVGRYEVLNMDMIVALKGEHALLLSVFGQPEYELEPYKGAEFHVEGMSNFSLEFQRDDAGAVTQALLSIPEGAFLAKKQSA